MEQHIHESSAVKTWFLVLVMVGWVAFKGWLAYTVIGDLGQPDWDYRPIMDVPGESAYTIADPYHPLPYAQHVLGELGKEENPSQLYIIPFQGVE
jgi:hypothetical protein